MQPVSAHPGTRRSVCAVVVTYHPDHAFAARFGRVLPQVHHAVIVDNASSADEVRMLSSLSAKPGVTLTCNPTNVGIAHALNTGVRQALAGDHDWILLLDQDTVVDANLVDGLLSVHASCRDGNAVAIVGSGFRDTGGRADETRRLEAHGDAWDEVESVITSGSLLSASAYRAVGSFRDDFFIDCVDIEFCLRARAAGYRIIQSRQPFMAHTIGTPTAHTFLRSTTWTTNHPPDRRYYRTRNDTVMLREYGTSGGGPWQLKSLTRCARLVKRIALFEQDKLSKIGAVAQGWWDAVRGRMGPRRRR